jgi:hypothetical protein
MKCGYCQRELSQDEAVYQHRGGSLVNYGWLTSICIDCLQKLNNYHPTGFQYALRHYKTNPDPCVHCGRPIFRYWHYRPRPAFCSEACRWAYQNAQVSQLRARRRGTIQCAKCSKQFQPKRTDACYCSHACKQAAYRQRIHRALRSTSIVTCDVQV